MISLSVPARSGYVQVLRSVVSGVGASADLSIDEIDDLRLAVDEACAHLLKLAADATTMRLEIASLPGLLDVTVAIVSPLGNGDAPSTDQFLTWHILAALTDGAEAVQREDGPAIRFVKRKTSTPR